MLDAYNNFPDAWKAHIIEKGLGNSLQDTIGPFKEYYGTIGSSKTKGKLLDKIRNAKDGEAKIEELAKILETAKNA